MRRESLLIAWCLLASSAPILAQSRSSATDSRGATASRPSQVTPERTPEQIEASFAAHKGDFDYLLGDWTFTAESKEYGKMRGYWSAVRLDEGQILDEYRIVGDKEETYYVTTTLRNYNKFMDRWELIGADAGSGLQDFGTGRRTGTEMHIEQRFGVASGRPAVWKIRYYDIQPDRFSWTADRSVDGGKTWVKNHQHIEARRIGPARALAPLAPAKTTQSPAADPISGTWSGSMGPNDTERHPISAMLKFDGKTITGTITGPPNPGTVRAGTFDPATGVLRFEVEVQDNDKTIAVFEGKAIDGMASGRVSFKGQTGTFSITKRDAGGQR
jgi:hypothetical protein